MISAVDILLHLSGLVSSLFLTAARLLRILSVKKAVLLKVFPLSNEWLMHGCKDSAPLCQLRTTLRNLPVSQILVGLLAEGGVLFSSSFVLVLFKLFEHWVLSTAISSEALIVCWVVMWCLPMHINELQSEFLEDLHPSWLQSKPSFCSCIFIASSAMDTFWRQSVPRWKWNFFNPWPVV